MLDYDARLPEEDLIKELNDIQNKFKKGDCEVFVSSIKTIYKFSFNRHPITIIPIKKFHVYFFQDMMTYWEAMKIIFYSSCCKAFKRWRMIRPNVVLRVSAKSDGFVPQPFMIIKSKYSKPEIRWFKDYVYSMLKNEVDKNSPFSDSRIGNERDSRNEHTSRSCVFSEV
jgi:hypothetical protein